MTSLGFDVVKIVDDDLRSANQAKSLIQNLDLRADLITDGSYTSVEQLLDKILAGGQKVGVLCDHRLMHGALASFYGSELVATLYKHQVPSILTTEFSHADINTSIRKYRRWTPVMMSRRELNMSSVLDAFAFCEEELAGNTPSPRIPYRTLVEIHSVQMDARMQVAEATLGGWQADDRVRFPLSLMSKDDQVKTCETVKEQGFAFLFADVNIGAYKSADLFFENFEWVENPTTSPLDTLYK